MSRIRFRFYCTNSIIRIFAITGPATRIIQDVLTDALEGFVRSNNTFEIITLPNSLPRCLAFFIDVSCGKCFKPANDFGRPCRFRDVIDRFGLSVGADFKPAPTSPRSISVLSEI